MPRIPTFLASLLGVATGLTWTACRNASVPADCCEAVLPGTALHTLLGNGTFTQPGSDTPLRDPYVDTWLRDAIPDINETGRAFWTFAYKAILSSADVPGCSGPLGTTAVAYATLEQGSYRMTLFLDGALVRPASGNESDAKGMFRRFDWALGGAASFCAAPTHSLRFEVAPPDHPGVVNGGQGGDHFLSQDLISQDLAGWDWVAGVPDRNTGLFDALEFGVAPAGVLLRDPAVAVLELRRPPGTPPSQPVPLAAAVRVSLMPLSNASLTGVLSATVAGADFSARVSIPAGSAGTWIEATTNAVDLAAVQLWWPHTAGEPALYDAVASLRPDSGEEPVEARWRAGFRVVTSEVDAGLGGQVFSINGERVFLQGGNFITTDIMNRAAYRTPERYWDEVRMHREMGMNVMRLWGGNGGAARGLWDAADEQGVLIFQEFWQSGDNNGRWAGSQSWPLDHPGYVAAAADTMRAARGHASLLLYNAGNEIFPPNETWAPAPLSALAQELDPRGTPFEWSSMGNITEWWLPDKILAPNDGNYGINDEREYFGRNPGLKNASMPIAFQPEIGNTAHPDFDSLARMFTPAAQEALPPPNATSTSGVHDAWVFHCWLPFTDTQGVDHAWALAPHGPTNASRAVWNASEYSLAAGFAQAVQYQALFEGFSDAAWAWYSAVIFWKSAAPWPSLRGSLYDWYLAQSGGYWGARAGLAAGRPLRAQLNRRNNTISIVHKGVVPAAGGPWIVTVSAWDAASGESLPLDPPYSAQVDGPLPPNTVTHLPATLSPPLGAAPGAVVLYRVLLLAQQQQQQQQAAVAASATRPISAADYLLSTLDPNSSVPQNLTALAAARYGGGALLELAATAQGRLGSADRFGRPVVTVNITLTNPGPAVAVAVGVTLRSPLVAVTAETGFTDDRVLPQWAADSTFNVVRGETRTLGIEAVLPAAGAARYEVRASAATSATFYVTVSGWNIARRNVTVELLPAA